MRLWKWQSAPAVGALALALVTVPGALAQCGSSAKLVKPSAWHPQYGAGHPMLVLAGFDDRDEHEASIVGMWHEVFTAKTSNGVSIPDTVIENALVVWHQDRTEIMNSARPPQDGQFCMGVWEQTGRSKYFLNHFAWAGNEYAPGTPNGVVGDPAGPTHFAVSVTLSPDGYHFSGHFRLDAFDTSGKIIQSFTGVVTGTRITTHTKVGDLL